MDIAEWVKKNKKHIARELVRKIDFAPSEVPSGIFTAGLPGAGKTEFTVELIQGIEPKPLRLDMDEIAALIEGYRPEIADKFRLGASTILGTIYNEVIKNKINFVFDGTFRSEIALANLKRALAHGYQIKLYYIHQEPTVAWRFTRDRELVEHRAIDRQGFIETYSLIHANLQKLCDNHKNVTISIVIKDEKNKIGRMIENVNDQLFAMLPKFLTQEQLEAAIV